MADSTQSQNLSDRNPIELAWAAGFFDGEGNARFRMSARPPQRSRAYGTFTIQIAQIGREVLDRFEAAVGIGKVYGPYTKKNGSQSQITYFSYSAHGSTGEQAYALIRPYLSSVKRAQGDDALLLYKESGVRPKLGNGHLRKKELAALAAETAT